MRQQVEQIITNALSKDVNVFDSFVDACCSNQSRVSSLAELRHQQSQKRKGDLFEAFCVLYLEHFVGYKHAWLLCQVPDHVRQMLRLGTQDMGIDLVAEDQQGNYHAVQCKFRKPVKGRKNVLPWSCLSTFYALCSRTGPWASHLVMTNCDYVKRVGTANDKDRTVCLDEFRDVSRQQWMDAIGMQPVKLCDANEGNPDIETLRQLRLKHFGG
jgi:predicted helicase